MSNEDYKNKLEGDNEVAEETVRESASRARNQTVVLTPEMAGQVRALLNKNASGPDPLSDIMPPSEGIETVNKVSNTIIEDKPLENTSVNKELLENATAVFSVGGTGNFSNLSSPGQGGASSVMTPSGPQGMPISPITSGNNQVTSFQREPQPLPVVVRRSKIVGFLVSFDNDEKGEVYEIAAGRWLVTSRRTEHNDFILIEDDTISPLHAIVRATKDGKIQILDQLSEYGTGVRSPDSEEEVEISGTMVVVEHGSVVRFGERYFVVCVVPKYSVTKEDREE